MANKSKKSLAERQQEMAQRWAERRPRPGRPKKPVPGGGERWPLPRGKSDDEKLLKGLECLLLLPGPLSPRTHTLLCALIRKTIFELAVCHHNKSLLNWLFRHIVLPEDRQEGYL